MISTASTFELPCSTSGDRFFLLLNDFVGFQLLLDQILFQSLLARFADIPDQTDKTQHADDVVTDIDFPPLESLAGAALIVMVVVVPALAQGQDRGPPVVLALVRGRIAATAPEMTGGINQECTMIEEDRADQEAPNNAAPAIDPVAERCDRQARHPRENFVEQPEFGILLEVFHGAVGTLPESTGDHPAHVSPPYRSDDGGMRIVLRVRMLVVVAVVSSPPERTFLQGRATDPGEDKLEPAAGLVRPVGEIAMVNTGDAEHSHHVKENGQADSGPGEWNEKRRHQRGNMDQEKWNGSDPLSPGDTGASYLCDGNRTC